MSFSSFPSQQQVNFNTTQMWFEQNIATALEKFVTENWGQKPDKLRGYRENVPYNNALNSVYLSFYRRLRNEVLRDVFIHGGDIAEHHAILESFRTGQFPPYIVGRFDEAQKTALEGLIVQLAMASVDAVKALKLPHAPMRDKNHVSLEQKPSTIATPKLPPTALTGVEYNALSKLRGNIRAAIFAADARGIAYITKQLEDKSALLFDEIRALEKSPPRANLAHDITLKQQHRQVIVEGIAHSLARERKLKLMAEEQSKISPPSPMTQTKNLRNHDISIRDLAFGAARKIRQHLVAAVAGVGAVAAGIALAFQIGGSAPQKVPAPQLSPAYNSQAVKVTPLASVAVASHIPAAATPALEKIITANIALAEKTEVTEKVFHKAVVTPPHPRSGKSAIPSAVAEFKPATVSGVVFQRTTYETIRNMCSKGFQTWACESQPS